MSLFDRSAPDATSRIPASGFLMFVGGLCLALGYVAPHAALGVGFYAAGVTFAILAVGMWAKGQWSGRSRDRAYRTLAQLVEHDVAACLLAGLDGRVIRSNRAARKLAPLDDDLTVPAVLGAYVSDPAGLVHRVQLGALAEGIAAESVVLPKSHLRVSAHHAGPEVLLWRLEPFEGRGAASDAGMQYPTLTIGRGGTVLWMNAAARDLAGGRVRRIDDLLPDTPLTSGAVQHVETDGPVRDFVVNIHDAGMGREEVVLVPSTTPPGDVAQDPGFDALPVPLLKLTPQGVIRRANRSARDLLRASGTEEGVLADFMEGLGRSIGDWLADAAAGRGLRRSEFLRLTRSDREVFVQVTLTRIVERGEPFLIAVLNDATELKSLEAQFVQGQKMQAIGQLAGGVAHDFNNLLTAISGHCDLLLLRHDQGDPEYGDLIQIHQNANRAAGLVGQLLAFSRKQTLRPEPLDLRDILADLTHLLNRLVGEKVVLELRQTAVLPMIRADKRQLEQVIMNLVVNARDAMSKGGRILIETDEQVLSETLRNGRAKVPAGTYVIVRVRDEGMGIPPDNLEKVFEPFFTTKRTGEGTGLGLSTVYGIVKQTGGFIFVDSVVDKGSTFTLMFPASEEGAPETAPAVEPVAVAPATRGDGVVLLVEDEAPVRAFASRALTLKGFQVIEACSAEDALELLADPGLHVDVFVTDVVMPGLDGPSWVRQARQDRPEVPVVFMSGYAEDVFKSQGARIDGSAFLAKPFSLTDLTAIVNQQIASGLAVPVRAAREGPVRNAAPPE